MQSAVWCGRVLSRTFLNGVCNLSTNADVSKNQPNARRYQFKAPHLTTGVSGFPKDLSARLRKGQIGDDAYFVAQNKSAEVLGVADGVGGWRHYGIDPGDFSSGLMRACERLVESYWFPLTRPAHLIARAFYELLQEKRQVLGSSTCCVLVVNQDDQRMYSANIGDSGFLLVRRGEVVHRSEEQQHYFNTPFQLSLPPPGQSGAVLSDSPDSAAVSDVPLEDGDVILLATDGVFDNLPDHALVAELTKLEGVRDPDSVQKSANAIALMARRLAFDANYMSPFAKNARANGIEAVGGKPDDITVLIATVAM